MKTSHLMRFINREHKRRVAEKEKLERKLTHYYQSSNSNSRCKEKESGGGSILQMHESVMSENMLPFGVTTIGKKRGFSVDSAGSSLSIVTSSFGSDSGTVKISLQKDVNKQRS